ncbi:MAG: ribonuclease P protein subunit [Thermoplasmatales archaeon]|nr:ribonuclease P protein subunit [Candidatus Thermoplasmatota archaeon]MCW6167374.1 ribonuclease P protein subunit [Thermoplasmatales archaeon]
MSDIRALPPELREALAGELIGAGIEIARAPSLGSRRLEGTIVDETQGMFRIRCRPDDRTIWVAKAGLEGTLLLEDRELPLRGDVLRIRPQDRTKRLLQAGPKRVR